MSSLGKKISSFFKPKVERKKEREEEKRTGYPAWIKKMKSSSDRKKARKVIDMDRKRKEKEKRQKEAFSGYTKY